MADRKIEIPGGGKLNVRIDGKEGAPWVTLSNSLATTIALWDDFVPAIADRYRILRYDQRGHGGSDAPPGPYPITRLGQDIVALWDALGIRKTHMCGVSLGGALSNYMAVHHSDRLYSAIPVNAPHEIGEAQMAGWDARKEDARKRGIKGLSQMITEGWLTPERVAARVPAYAKIQAMVETTNLEGYIACMCARDSLKHGLAGTKLPFLSIASEKDGANPQHMEIIHKLVQGSQFAIIPDAGHLPMIERPEIFTPLVAKFLDSVKI